MDTEQCTEPTQSLKSPLGGSSGSTYSDLRLASQCCAGLKGLAKEGRRRRADTGLKKEKRTKSDFSGLVKNHTFNHLNSSKGRY